MNLNQEIVQLNSLKELQDAKVQKIRQNLERLNRELNYRNGLAQSMLARGFQHLGESNRGGSFNLSLIGVVGQENVSISNRVGLLRQVISSLNLVKQKCVNELQIELNRSEQLELRSKKLVKLVVKQMESNGLELACDRNHMEHQKCH
jgi:multidrug efflux pump subunit AcrA (membrane-fusion protein)